MAMFLTAEEAIPDNGTLLYFKSTGYYTPIFAALILVFADHGELHAQGVQDGIDGFKAWVCACAQGFVQAFPAKSCVFGDLGHASGLGHIAERCDEYFGVGVFGGGRKIFGNHSIVIEVGRHVEWLVSRFLFLHGFCFLVGDAGQPRIKIGRAKQ